jgi:hypothetical protein
MFSGFCLSVHGMCLCIIIVDLYMLTCRVNIQCYVVKDKFNAQKYQGKTDALFNQTMYVYIFIYL